MSEKRDMLSLRGILDAAEKIVIPKTREVIVNPDSPNIASTIVK